MENRKKYLSLDDILADDDFNLIEEPIKAITSTPITADERLVTSFQNILDFYEKTYESHRIQAKCKNVFWLQG
jgi:hypothetical protein